ncbi:MAG: acriflavin resistance protein [Gemmatimonadetes bacterium]|nr:acriflavin resistance protein [Gemmatimonadota bacterium]
MNPIKFSLRYPQVTYFFTAVIVAMGGYGLLKMPRREDPKIPFPVALVLAAYPGATAEQVEEQLTKPVEEHLFRFSEIDRKKTWSTSRPGAMIVWVQVNDQVKKPDIFWSKLRHDLNELHFTSLPQGVQGPILNSEFGDVSAMLLAVQGDKYGSRELKDYLRTIEDELRTLPAVSKIKRLGEQKEQIYVTSTWERLSQYGLTAFQIIGSLQQKNAVMESGALMTEAGRVPLRTSGLFQAEEQIRRQVVGVSPRTGQPIYLGDFANVERRYADPTSIVRVNGKPAMLLSLEMQEGNNIVDFGKAVHERLQQVRPRLPADLAITEIVDQPRVVKERIGHFLRDFGLAIAVVVAVVILLLPIRVAAIAAGAIPVTLMATFAVMQLLGIELHQVSLAGLIVCLGLVVDDAIVIADNYVDLLDHGVPPDEAAWKAPSQLFVPVLIATLTIIAAFLPMAFLPGDTGNFIFSLPVTIAVAMGCSLIVAMLLTPLMCRAFIKKGLMPTAEDTARRRRRSPLDVMQSAYDRTITAAMAHRGLTMTIAVLSVAAGGALFGVVRQQFFPSAERDQFPIKVWMPAGTSIDGTDAVVRKIEGILGKDKDIVSYASFVGSGAPRFYYNYDPPYDNTNLAEFIVNTTSLEATKRLVPRLSRSLAATAPEAEIVVKELQQGNAVRNPVEVRISGPDIAQLKRLAAGVAAIFEATPGTRTTRTDFREDIQDVRVKVNDELASRLGLSTALISQSLAGSLLGAPVSTFWEGDRALDILLRVDESRRQSFDDVRNMYLTSPVTGARTPLREVVSLEPVWASSHIIRRNGIRTIAVGTDTDNDAEPTLLPSDLLKRVQKRVNALAMPPGYSLVWGGEIEGQQDSFGPMTVALGISMLIIFMLLLFQFRRVSNVLVVMASIPLSLFGALLGLIVTGNPFGFTAFLGLISLSGVVVRNGIILLEWIEERRAHGVDLMDAATEAGKRRLRPIFLTSVAAAVGVLPMILSGSAMWAPLGAVISLGILCSMVFTLVFIPVLYLLVHRRGAEKAAVRLEPTMGYQPATREAVHDLA